MNTPRNPFNFPMQLPAHSDGTVGLMTVISSKPSQSRRGGHKVTIGFVGSKQDGAKVAPVMQLRLEQN